MVESGKTEVEYFNDGSRKSETQYMNGVKHGNMIEYDKNGNTKVLRRYTEGRNMGKKVFSYYADGVL